jgi:hypothetical protein
LIRETILAIWARTAPRSALMPRNARVVLAIWLANSAWSALSSWIWVF